MEKSLQSFEKLLSRDRSTVVNHSADTGKAAACFCKDGNVSLVTLRSKINVRNGIKI
jgi:hypothetical protein